MKSWIFKERHVSEVTLIAMRVESGVECEEWVGVQGKNTLELQMQDETNPSITCKSLLRGSFPF